jgi:subtilisin family serine protease
LLPANLSSAPTFSGPVGNSPISLPARDVFSAWTAHWVKPRFVRHSMQWRLPTQQRTHLMATFAAPRGKARNHRQSNRHLSRQPRRLLLESLEDRSLLAGLAGAASPFAAGEILVGFEGDLAGQFRLEGPGKALQSAAARYGGFGLEQGQVLMHRPGDAAENDRLITLWKLPRGKNVSDVAARLSQLPGVAYAEPNYVVSVGNTPLYPNDQRFGSLWGMHNTGQSGGTPDADIDAPEAWGVHTGSGNVVVAVIDTGVNYQHRDLAANIWVNPYEVPGNGIDDDGNGFIDDVHGADFVNNDGDPLDDHGHGTHVSGTIGAVGNNGTGVVGVNWDVQIMGLKFLSGGGTGTTADAVRAVDYATQMRQRGVNLVLTNNSWGGGGYSAALRDAIAASGDTGMLFVASAGNSGWSTADYPALYDVDNIISVAATDRNDQLASFSNYGTGVDIAAPGVDILSTVGNNYGTMSGTSMAAPHVSGAAALVWDYLLTQGVTPDYAMVRDSLFAGSNQIPSTLGTVASGGRLNVHNALATANTLANTTRLTIADASVAEGDFGTTAIALSVTRGGKTNTTTTLDWSTADGTARAGSDYVAASGQLTFLPGETHKLIEVGVAGDTLLEPDEVFRVVLSNVTNQIGGESIPLDLQRSEATATIHTDDVQPVFNFSDFADASAKLNLLSSASVSADSRLRLTPAEGGRVGAAWYTVEKPLVAGYFETTFQFHLHAGSDSGGIGGSDGFAFVIQNSSPLELRGGGGGLGYVGMPNSVAIEFDTFRNSELNDPSESHISVHTGGTGSNGSHESFSLGARSAPLDDGQVHTARITYSPGVLSVYLDDLTSPILTVQLDLADALQLDTGRAWVGFTAATGGGYQNHDILNWSLSNIDRLLWTDSPAVVEGADGTSTVLSFTLQRLGGVDGELEVNWSTADGTATAGSDYLADSGTVTFADGQSQQTVEVIVLGDQLEETNETIRLLLSTSGDYVALGGRATILNDDATVSISDTVAQEGGNAIKLLDRFISEGSGGLGRPRGMAFGPDASGDGLADLYATSADSNQILRYDGVTGEFLGEFVSNGSGGLTSPVDLVFAPDGTAYVTGSGAVLRYDSATGAFLEQIAGGLVGPQGISVGEDGSVYIAVQSANEILRYDGTELSVFVTAGSGGLTGPRKAVFGPDGNGDGFKDLYIASVGTKQVLRYDGRTGAFLDVFTSTNIGSFGNGPIWLEFGTDGYLYTAVRTDSTNLPVSLVRFDAAMGSFVDSFDLGRDGWAFTIGPDGLIYDASTSAGSFVDRLGPSSIAAFTVNLSGPIAAPVTVQFSTADGAAVAGSDYVAAAGSISFAPGQTARTILVQTINDGLTEDEEIFIVNLTQAQGAVIADGHGMATILDDDLPITKFYVVDDGSADQTYEYASGGTAVENYALASGNSAPRGAASTAAGDKVWVVDASRKVYVYDAGGGLLGSWNVGSVPKSAVLEGLATNGNDVWIVDNATDKVFRYAAAATRLSGNQNAASSFSLAAGNTNPKDLVTDGVHLWVVDDSSTDKVFKYTLSGSLVGSWTISTDGATAPTGITLDPAAPGQLWIVDNAADRVYQYDNAVGRDLWLARGFHQLRAWPRATPTRRGLLIRRY